MKDDTHDRERLTSAQQGANYPALLDLRGHFLLPQAEELQLEQRQPLYSILNVFPVTDEQAVLVSHQGAVLVNARSKEVLWTIICPSLASAIDLHHNLLALAAQGQIFLWDLRRGYLVRILDIGDDAATDMAFRADGSLLVVALFENGVQLWQIADGILLHTLNVAGDDYGADKSVAFSPDGRFVASGNFEDEAVWLWRVADGQLVQKMEEHPSGGRVEGLAFSPDGQLLVCGDAGGERGVTGMRVWDAGTGRSLPGFPRKEWKPVFRPDGQLLASTQIVDHAYVISLWDVATRSQVRQLAGHKGRMHHMAFSPSGRILVSCAEDRTARWWDTQSGQELYRIEALLSTHTRSAFSPDGRLLALSTWDGKVRLWNVSNGKLLRVLPHYDIHSEGGVFSADGNEVAVWTQYPLFSGTISIYYVNISEVRFELRGPQQWVFCAAFNHDDTLFAAGCDEEQIRLWRLPGKTLLHTLKGHTDRICSLAFSPKGGLLASGSKDGKILLWRVTGGPPAAILEGHTQGVVTLVFSPDGQWLASGSEDHTIHVWQVATGRLQQVLQGHTATVVSVAFSLDGKRIASGSEDKHLWVWEVGGKQQGRKSKPVSRETIPRAFAMDGTRLPPDVQEESVLLWEFPKELTDYQLKHEYTQLTSVAFQPDGSLLAAGYCSGLTQVWRLEQLG